MIPARSLEQYPGPPTYCLLSRYPVQRSIANSPDRLIPTYTMDLLLSIPLISTLMTPSWTTYMNILFFYTVSNTNFLLRRRRTNTMPRSGPPSSSPMMRRPSTPAPSSHCASSSGWRHPLSSSHSTPSYQVSLRVSSLRGRHLSRVGRCAFSDYQCSTCCS